MGFFLIFSTCEKAHVKHLLCLRNFGSLKHPVRFEIHANWGMNHKEGCWSVDNTSQLQKGQRTLISALMRMICIQRDRNLQKFCCVWQRRISESLPTKPYVFIGHYFILRFVCVFLTGNQKKWIKLTWFCFSF